MRPIGFESKLIKLSNGSRIASIGVRTKPGRAREIGSKICLTDSWVSIPMKVVSIQCHQNLNRTLGIDTSERGYRYKGHLEQNF